MRQLLIMCWLAGSFVTAVMPHSEAGSKSIPFAQSADLAIMPRQTKAERSQLIREAEKNHYTVRRIEFVGNEHIRDSTLRRRLRLNEGDRFTRRGVENDLQRLNRLKLIYPVTIDDVDLHLDRQEKLTDFIIYFRERPYVSRGSKIY